MRDSVERVARRWMRLARKDQEKIQVAASIYTALLRLVSSGRGMTLNPARNEVVIQGKALGLGKLTDKLYFDFSSEAGTFYQARKQRVHREKYYLFASNYKEEIKKEVTRNKKIFIHELVHHVDALQIGDAADRGYKTPDVDEVAYYNHSSEMNAFFQQAAEPFVKRHLDIVSDLEDDTGPENKGSNAHLSAVWKLSDLSKEKWGRFFTTWKRSFGAQSKFWETLTPKNQRRMQKRVYDLFDKTVGDAKRRMVDLKNRGDTMAEQM